MLDLSIMGSVLYQLSCPDFLSCKTAYRCHSTLDISDPDHQLSLGRTFEVFPVVLFFCFVSSEKVILYKLN